VAAMARRRDVAASDSAAAKVAGAGDGDPWPRAVRLGDNGSASRNWAAEPATWGTPTSAANQLHRAVHQDSAPTFYGRTSVMAGREFGSRIAGADDQSSRASWSRGPRLVSAGPASVGPASVGPTVLLDYPDCRYGHWFVRLRGQSRLLLRFERCDGGRSRPPIYASSPHPRRAVGDTPSPRIARRELAYASTRVPAPVTVVC
jgi:hypothetical protein